MIPVASGGAGIVVTNVRVLVMRVERVLRKDDVASCSGMVVIVASEVVVGKSVSIVTVTVLGSSEDASDVSSRAVGDACDAGGGAGERMGPTGPMGEFVLVGSAGSSR